MSTLLLYILLYYISAAFCRYYTNFEVCESYLVDYTFEGCTVPYVTYIIWWFVFAAYKEVLQLKSHGKLCLLHIVIDETLQLVFSCQECRLNFSCQFQTRFLSLLHVRTWGFIAYWFSSLDDIGWRRRIFRTDLGPLRGSSSPVDALNRWGWNPIKLAYKLAGWLAQLATSAFNQLSQYANSPGHRAYCYWLGLSKFPWSSLFGTQPNGQHCWKLAD